MKRIIMLFIALLSGVSLIGDMMSGVITGKEKGTFETYEIIKTAETLEISNDPAFETSAEEAAETSGSQVYEIEKDYYTEDELYWMSRIIFAESSGESYEGKLAVGTVVMNRKKSREFPNTVYGVIFDKNPTVQFTPCANGTIYRSPDDESIRAAREVLEGFRTDNEIIYFLNPKIASNFWIVNNRTYVMTIGNHDFYK